MFEMVSILLADLGDTSSVLKEFDSVLYDKTCFGNPSGLVDAASLLWRLNIMGVDPGEKRWEKVFDGFSKHRSDHTTSWLVSPTHIPLYVQSTKGHVFGLSVIKGLTAMTTGQL